uniref:Regulator of G-protein signaling 18-like n=1 Tax=Sinocyclocheilus grahami TaxID=75366 RepID=A0A672N3G5_SINGR
MLRKFSSEGSLLELDFLPWGDRDGTPDSLDDLPDGASASYPCTPDAKSGSAGKGELKRDYSISMENLSNLEKDSGLLKVTNLNESFKAYSDSQLTGNAKASFESVGKCEGQPHSPSSTLKSGHMPVSPKPPLYHRQQARAKLTAAKLHLKSLFGQGSPQSSHSNLASAEHSANVTRLNQSHIFSISSSFHFWPILCPPLAKQPLPGPIFWPTVIDSTHFFLDIFVTYPLTFLSLSALKRGVLECLSSSSGVRWATAELNSAGRRWKVGPSPLMLCWKAEWASQSLKRSCGPSSVRKTCSSTRPVSSTVSPTNSACRDGQK